jgi:hypothetical protein
MMILAKLAPGRLLSALRAIMGLVARYPLQCACAGLLIACAWLWHGGNVARAERDAAIAAKVAQAAEFSAAVEEAERLNREARAAVATKTRELADAADDHARDLDAISRRALADRVQGKGVCASAAPAASLSVDSEVAAGTDSGGAVAFTADEADALRKHELRSTICYGWVAEMIEAGFAVEAE